MKTGPKPRSCQDAYNYIMANARQLEGGCLIYDTGRPINFGYRIIRAGGESWYVHRLIYFIHHGFKPFLVRHTCHVPTCVEPTHLILGSSHAENVADTVAADRHQRGERHYRSKITRDDVNEILRSNEPYSLLSKRYGISRGGISNIKHGRTWK